MATRTGALSIDEIQEIPGENLALLKGQFLSLHDSNVGDSSRIWAADMLLEALAKLSSFTATRETLLDDIGMVSFTSPNTDSTRFEVVVSSELGARLRCGAWDSYTLG